jgi:hypothetical protein
MGGGKVVIPLTEIKRAGYIKGKSVMPENMTDGMGDRDFLDLISYLQTLK